MAVAFPSPKVANAQDGKGSINFVPYVGVNYSDFSGDTKACFNGTSGKVNFMAGARFEFQIAKESAIIADLNYRRLGATADNNHVVEASMLGDIINGYKEGDEKLQNEIDELNKKLAQINSQLIKFWIDIIFKIYLNTFIYLIKYYFLIIIIFLFLLFL